MEPDNSDDSVLLAVAIIGLGTDELARRIREELDAEAREALRRLRHPVTGDRLQVKGVSVANPPRHEKGSLTEKN
jgi:hypothetical protein